MCIQCIGGTLKEIILDDELVEKLHFGGVIKTCDKYTYLVFKIMQKDTFETETHKIEKQCLCFAVTC